MKIAKELDRVEECLKQVERIRKNIKEAAETTSCILQVCESLGVDIVGVGCKHPDIEGSLFHPFGASGAVFAGGVDEQGWPLAWSIVRMAGISGGCGNPGQHQVSAGTKMLDGVYRCKDGVWEKDE